MLMFIRLKDWYKRKYHEVLDNKFNIKPGYIFTKHPRFKEGELVIGEMYRLMKKYKVNVGFTNYQIPGHGMIKDSNGYWVQKVSYTPVVKSEFFQDKDPATKEEFEEYDKHNWSNYGVHPWLVNNLWKRLPKWLTDKLAKYKWRKYNDR